MNEKDKLKKHIFDSINAVQKIMSEISEETDCNYSFTIDEARILEEKPTKIDIIYDSFCLGFYKGMQYQNGMNQNVIEERRKVSPVQLDQEEYGHFKLHMFNSQYGIASCKLCDIPNSYVPRSVRNGKNLMQTLFFYMKECDMIVLNEENILSHAFGELIVELLSLSEEEIAKEMTRLKEVSPEYFEKLVTVLGIQEYRRIMRYHTYKSDSDKLMYKTIENASIASERLSKALCDTVEHKGL